MFNYKVKQVKKSLVVGFDFVTNTLFNNLVINYWILNLSWHEEIF